MKKNTNLYYQKVRKSCGTKKKATELINRKKFCPVCGNLAAVLDGNPEIYGEKAVPWNTFIRVKYCGDECREIMKRQSQRLSNKRRRRERKAYRDAFLEAMDTLREEVRVSREETRLLLERIAELEAGA